jgi:hypothetical protein
VVGRDKGRFGMLSPTLIEPLLQTDEGLGQDDGQEKRHRKGG